MSLISNQANQITLSSFCLTFNCLNIKMFQQSQSYQNLILINIKMIRSKQIKSVYNIQSENQTLEKQNLSQSYIMKTNSRIVTPKSQINPHKPNNLNTSLLMKQFQMSRMTDNEITAIDVPEATILPNSAYSKYFSQTEFSNDQEASPNKRQKMKMSEIHKILNPYVQETQKKHKSGLIYRIDEIYQNRINMAFRMIKKPFEYVHTIKKLPTFALEESHNSAKVYQSLSGQVIKNAVSGIIRKQNISKRLLQSAEKQPVQNNINKSQNKNLNRNQSINSCKWGNNQPMLNKLMLNQPQLIQKLYYSQHNQQQASRHKNTTIGYSKIFSIINEPTARKQ